MVSACDLLTVGEVVTVVDTLATNPAHSCIIRECFSNKSPRRRRVLSSHRNPSPSISYSKAVFDSGLPCLLMPGNR